MAVGRVLCRGTRRAAGCGTDCRSWEVMCPHTTFHASRGSAQAYLAARPGIDGEILGQQASIDLGRRIFGPLLGRTFRGP